MPLLGKRPVRSRNTTSSTTGSTAGKKAKVLASQQRNSSFERVLSEAGLHLNGNKDQFNELLVDEAIFKYKLAHKLKQDFTCQMIDEFCHGFLEFIEKPVCFRQCLLPTWKSEDNSNSSPVAQESVFRMFLGIEVVQPKVVTILLEKLPEYMEESLRDDSLAKEEFKQIPGLVLNQLKWLDCVVDGKELCSKLMEILSISSVELQQDIVSSLPEILDDSMHPSAANQLKDMLQSNSQLTSAIIHCFTNMNLSDAVTTEILDIALQIVVSADLTDLPVVLSFIMQSAATLDTEQIILQLRDKLDLPSTFVAPLVSSTPRSKQKGGGDKQGDNKYMIFDTIKSLICFQTKVADGWMKAIQGIESAQQHKVIDIFILLILHSTGSRKKSVESLFKSKVKGGLFTEELIGEVFSTHVQAIQDYFPSILALAELLMCTNVNAVQLFAGVLYRHMFTCFDVYCQQEVIGALVTHIGSGTSAEANSALEVLDTLVNTKLQAVQRFTLLIKGLLDYFIYMDTSQIRKLYSILITLSFCGEESTGSSVQDEVYGVIQKQLSHVESKYRKMGIIGAMMIFKKVGQAVEDEDDMIVDESLPGSSSQLTSFKNSTYSKQVMPVLKMMMDLCQQSADSAILFYDEMASVISSSNIDHEIIDYISKKVTSDFQDFYLIESETALPNIFDLPLECLFGLDTSDEANISLNLLPLVLKQPQQSVASLRCMPSHFHLLQAAEVALHEGSLEGIDALLGCSIVGCSYQSDYGKYNSSQRETICFMLFHMINWFRELVTTFSVEQDIEMRTKVVRRLKAITELENLLEEWIIATPSFLPSLSTMYEAIATSSAVASGKGKQGRKTSSTSTSKLNPSRIGDKDLTASLDKESVSSGGNVKALLQPFWRPLGLSVFNILSYGALQSLPEENGDEHESEMMEVGPQQLLFLLQDLYGKMKMTLSPSVIGFFASKGSSSEDMNTGMQYDAKELAVLTTSLMKVIRQQLEKCAAYFQSQIKNNEEDSLILSTSDDDMETTMSYQFKVILQIITALLSWSKLSHPEHRRLLKDFCLAFNSEEDKSQSTTTMEEAAMVAVQYIGTFSVWLPNLGCAHVLVKSLVLLINTTKAVEMKNFVAELSGKLLKKSWQGSESGQQRNEALSYLLKYHIGWSQDVLDRVEVICANAIPASLEEDDKDTDDKYHTLSNQTISCYYRVMLVELVNHLKVVHTSNEDQNYKLMQLEISVRVLCMLVQVVKAFDKKPILAIALKYGQQYMENFLKSSMPFLDTQFYNNKDEVLHLLKSLQQSTRTMQHFCTYSKVHQDVTLTQHVPALKKSLEKLLFRVKDMLCKHNCEGAFWMGNLKNRDLQGNELFSQSQSVVAENEETCEKEIDADQDSSSNSEQNGT